MSYTRNLGRVRGKKGGYYDINLTNKANTNTWNFQLNFEENIEENEPLDKETTLAIPMYVPNLVEGDNGEQQLVFNLVTTTDIQQTYSLGNVRGDQGPPGKVTIDMEHTEYANLSEMEADIESLNPNTHTIYIITKSNLQEMYVWHEDETETLGGHFDSIEGFNLENYYTKDETYSKNEIDQFITEINYYDKLALGILDVTYGTTVEEFINTMTIDDLAEIFARREDLFVDIIENENDNTIDSIIINVGRND